MLRGINRESIFQEPEDYDRFLQVLRQCKAICGFELFAWCLMDNHVHLLMRAGEEPVALVMKRIGCRYVYWYNKKYDRIGHLFQDRYRSEAFETDAYFLTVLRYILQNPIKAGMESRMGDYPYTAFSAYKGRPDGLTDVGFATEYFNDQSKLLDFLTAMSDEKAMDVSPMKKQVSDGDVLAWIKDIAAESGTQNLAALDREKLRSCVQTVHQRGATVRQIAAVLGIPKSNIARMIQ